MQVSPLVDSCSRLIHLKALRTYRHISPENKRWIDLEDVIQDGLIEAWQASERYHEMWDTKKRMNRPKTRRKFSTYLYHGLDMLFSARYRIPLSQAKRKAALSELDAPVPGTDLVPELESLEATPEQLFEAVSGVIRVCCSVPPQALSFLLQVVTSETGKIRRRNVEDIACIPDACAWFRVGRQDLALVMASPYAKGVLLEAVVSAAGGVLGEEDAKVLECVTCRGMFSLADAREGRYSSTSLTCAGCLKNLFGAGPENSCFGRRKEVHNTRTVTEGYSEADDECRLHCRDRMACRRFIEGRERHMGAEVDNMEIESDLDIDGVDLSDIETGDTEPVVTESKSKSAKAKKTAKAKPAKAAKETKSAKATKTAKVAPAKKEAKPAKAAKPAQAEKASKTAKPKAAKERKPRKQKSAAKMDPKEALKKGLIKLDDKGRDLPFKEGSTMRFYLEKALQPGGADVKELEKFAAKNGYNHRFQMSVLRSGKSGDSSLRPYPSTHTWKVEENEKKGTIKAYDVKRIAYYERMARIK